MRGRVLLGVLVLVPLALAAVVWTVLRQPKHRVRPGRVEVVLVDALGSPWKPAARVSIADATRLPGTALVFDVPAGVHQFVARHPPVGGCGTTATYEGGVFDLHVDGAPTDELQRLEVRLGRDVVTQSLNAAEDGVKRWSATRDVEVLVVHPDGGPVPGAAVYCNYRFTTADDDGVARCPEARGQLEVAAGKDGFGNEATVGEEDEEVTLVLDLPRMQLEVDVVGLPGATSIAVNSQGIRSDFFNRDGGHFVLPAIPLFRTIVCTRDTPTGACAVIRPPDGGSGPISVQLVAQPPGEVSFTAAVKGEPVLEPVAYIDRVENRPAASQQHVFTLTSGQHVLVLNLRRGPERYETVFTVEPGKRTELGVLELE